MEFLGKSSAGALPRFDPNLPFPVGQPDDVRMREADSSRRSFGHERGHAPRGHTPLPPPPVDDFETMSIEGERMGEPNVIAGDRLSNFLPPDLVLILANLSFPVKYIVRAIKLKIYF
jgi:hypothetical protein